MKTFKEYLEAIAELPNTKQSAQNLASQQWKAQWIPHIKAAVNILNQANGGLKYNHVLMGMQSYQTLSQIANYLSDWAASNITDKPGL